MVNYTPIIAIGVSAGVYWLIKKTILSHNTKIRALLVTPYLSGAVFLIYFAFFFTTEFYARIASSTLKRFLVPVLLLIGFIIGMIFKRMHFFMTKFTPAMKFSEALKRSACVLYFLSNLYMQNIVIINIFMLIKKKWMYSQRPIDTKFNNQIYK